MKLDEENISIEEAFRMLSINPTEIPGKIRAKKTKGHDS